MKYLIGMGNYSMGDDGIGLRIIEHLAESYDCNDFELIELGNNGIQLLTYFNQDTEKIVLIDAVRFGGTPGDYLIFSPEEVDTKKVISGISTHEGDVIKIIDMAKQLDLYQPEIRIFAIEPEQMNLDQGISNSLQNRFDDYLKAIMLEFADSK